jgi:hypothetical protein
MVVFGGTNGAGAIYDEVWQLALGDSAAWTPITPVGAPPSARARHSAVHDPVNDRVLVFGGLSAEGGLHELADVWSLSLSDPPSWSTLQPSGAGPSARFYHSAIYDPPRHRMLIFGGSNLTGHVFSDVWCLWLSPTPRWEQLRDSSATQRDHHTAIHDPVRDRMVVIGGGSNDAWAQSLADGAWTRLFPSGESLPRLSGHTAIYDPRGDRIIVLGGNDGNDRRNGVWALALAGAPACVHDRRPARARSARLAFRGLRFRVPTHGRVRRLPGHR